MKITSDWLASQPFESVSNATELRYDCPNCDDNGKHMYVTANRTMWYCFKCGVGGKVLYSKDTEPSIENFSKLSLLNKVKPLLLDTPNIRKSLPLNGLLPHIEIAEDCESSNELNARNYLHSRGVTQTDINKHDIRFSLEKIGPYRNSIIFPVTRVGGIGMLEYFVCRKYDNSNPKYVNAPWPKGDTLFITDYVSQATRNVSVIVEGIFDALAIGRLGYRGIALLGKAATSQQLNRLSGINSEFIIYLDDDALSHAVQLKLQLDALGNNTTMLRAYKDAADMYVKNPNELQTRIEHARKP